MKSKKILKNKKLLKYSKYSKYSKSSKSSKYSKNKKKITKKIKKHNMVGGLKFNASVSISNPNEYQVVLKQESKPVSGKKDLFSLICMHDIKITNLRFSPNSKHVIIEQPNSGAVPNIFQLSREDCLTKIYKDDGRFFIVSKKRSDDKFIIALNFSNSLILNQNGKPSKKISLLSSKTISTLEYSPDDTKIAISQQNNKDIFYSIYILDLAANYNIETSPEPVPKLIPDLPTNFSSFVKLSFSPDSQYLAGLTFTNQLIVVNLTDNSIIINKPDIICFSWLTNQGRLFILYYDKDDNNLYISGIKPENIKRLFNETKDVVSIFIANITVLHCNENGKIFILLFDYRKDHFFKLENITIKNNDYENSFVLFSNEVNICYIAVCQDSKVVIYKLTHNPVDESWANEVAQEITDDKGIAIEKVFLSPDKKTLITSNGDKICKYNFEP